MGRQVAKGRELQVVKRNLNPESLAMGNTNTPTTFPMIHAMARKRGTQFRG